MFQVKWIIFISGLALFLSIYTTILIKSSNIVRNYEPVSSVWCSGGNQTIRDRTCRFRNLCYRIDIKEFVFLLDKKRSIIVNVPENRFEPSLQYLGSVEHNNFHFNYVEVDYSNKDLFADHRFMVIKSPVLIFARFKPYNLMHSLHDDLLPLYHTVTLALFGERKSTEINTPVSLKNLNLIVIDNYHRIEQLDPFTRAFFSTVFQDVNILYQPNFEIKDQIVCFQDALVGLDKTTVWYDYGFKQFQKPIEKTSLQKRLIRLYTNEIRNSILRISSYSDQRFCNERFITLISRRRSRLIVNEDQLLELLEKVFELRAVKMDLDSDLEDIEHLLKVISCSRFMIGMHGAGLILAMFLPKDANLIELFPYKINADHYTPYKQLADIYELNYFKWTNQLKSNSIGNSKYIKDEIKSKIDADLEVEQSLCCDDPYFLYRIYQDTLVNTSDIQQFLNEIKDQRGSILINSKNNSIISPSRVWISCGRINHTIRLNWSKPWNLIDNQEDINYEVLVTVEKDQSIMYKTKDNQLLINIDANQEILVWIRAKFMNRLGPFDDKPFYC